jgi:hypothetical protein
VYFPQFFYKTCAEQSFDPSSALSMLRYVVIELSPVFFLSVPWLFWSAFHGYRTSRIARSVFTPSLTGCVAALRRLVVTRSIISRIREAFCSQVYRAAVREDRAAASSRHGSPFFSNRYQSKGRQRPRQEYRGPSVKADPALASAQTRLYINIHINLDI